MFTDLIGKRLSHDKMEILYSEPFTEASFSRDFTVCGGEWSVADGWLTGKNPDNAPGMIISRAEYNCDVLLEFRARTILPSTHDIDVMWSGSWDYSTNTRGTAYVMGIEGWWDGKLGIEKAPDYSLSAATKLFPFVPGRIYTVQCGSVAGHIFVIIDGVLSLEVVDPSPIDTSKYGLVGFEAYSSSIRFTDFKVKRAVYEEMVKKYTPEF